MKFIYLLIALYISPAFSFTLISNPVPQYSFDDAVVFNAANDACANIGISAEQYLELVQSAMDRYWNSVPTTRMKLTKGRVLNVSANGLTSVSALLDAGGEDNSIIVGCNNDVPSFAGGTIGIGGMRFSNGGAQGGFLINDSTLVGNLSEVAKEALIGHELGHALGLGHSAAEFALMYFSLNLNQEKLSKDDEDGITWLYPNEKEVGGVAGSCGTISLNNRDDDPPGGTFLLALSLGLLLSFIRPKLSFGHRSI